MKITKKSKQPEEKEKEERKDEEERKEEKAKTKSYDKSPVSWAILNSYFTENPNSLIHPHLDSFNSFSLEQIKSIIQKHNPIQFFDDELNLCELYLGGVNGEKIAFGKPVVYDNNEATYMYPNDARLRNMTYGSLIHVDVEMIIRLVKDKGKEKEKEKENIIVLDKLFLCNLPIMLNSKLCILHGLNKEVRYNMGEKRNDLGGYFIINGEEKYIELQEEWSDNAVITLNPNQAFVKNKNDLVSLEINTETGQIGVYVSGFKKTYVDSLDNIEKEEPIPLFILMRALGVESDKDIISCCLLNGFKNMEDLLIPSVHDSARVFDQETAITFLSFFTESKSKVWEVLTKRFLPEVAFDNKAMFLGYITFQLLCAHQGFSPLDKSEQLLKKKIVTPGSKLSLLFEDLYEKQVESIQDQMYDIYLNYRGNCDKEEPFQFIMQTYNKDFFKNKVIDDGIQQFFKTCCTALDSKNWYDYITKLRVVSSPFSPSFHLHGSYYGYYDALSSSRQLSLGSIISSKTDSKQVRQWIRENIDLKPCLKNVSLCKIFLDNIWIGCVKDGLEVVNEMKILRRNGIFPFYMSLFFDYKKKEVRISCTEGQILRGLYFIHSKPSFEHFEKNNEITWEKAVSGLREKHEDAKFSVYSGKVYSIKKLYPDNAANRLQEYQGYLDFVSPNEENSSLLIANDAADLNKSKYYTHVEFESSLLFGLNSSLYPFADHSNSQNVQDVSDITSQSCVTYERSQTEKSAEVLHYGQIPLVTSRYLSLVNGTEVPYGENVMIAVMTLDGYNASQGIIINEAAVQRGLFQSSYYETTESVENIEEGEKFENPLRTPCTNIEPNASYAFLNDSGFLKEKSVWQKKNVVTIGKTKNNMDCSTVYYNNSLSIHHNDSVILSRNQDGLRLAKVVVRAENKMKLGGVLASRLGLKSAVCLCIQEKDLPFDANGCHPDIIINPELLLTESGVSQVMEILYGNVAALYGTFMDSTAFQMKGANLQFFGSLLTKIGYNCYGNQIMYAGSTGEQLNASIFYGPAFFMKPIQEVQTFEGTDTFFEDLNALGMSATVQDFLSKEFVYLAICNKTGTIAVYNDARNIFYSLYLDGPISFHTKPNGELNVKNVTRYGKSFSIIKVPSRFKEIIRELQVCGIQLRVITDKNFDQLFNMSFSHNIHKLLHAPMDKTSDILIQNFTKKMKLALTNSKVIDVHEEEEEAEETKKEEIKKPISLEEEEEKEKNAIKIVVNPEIVNEDEPVKEEKKQEELFISTPLIKKVVNESVTSENILKVENEEEKEKKEDKPAGDEQEKTETKKSVSFNLKPEVTESSESSSVKKISI